MTRAEVARLIAERQTLWPGAQLGVPEGEEDLAVDTWMTVLGRFDYGAARAALHALRGGRFAPTPGQVEGVLMPPELGSPSEVMAEFRELNRAGRHATHPAYRDHTKGGWPPREAFSTPAVAAFALDAGAWEAFGQRPDPSFDDFAAAAAAGWDRRFGDSVRSFAETWRREGVAAAVGAAQRALVAPDAEAQALPSDG